MSHRLSPERIARAREAIDAAFLDTPQFESPALGERLGCRLVVKVETMTPIGSFKARGAHWLASQLSGRPHLVCATAGNFGQGMAHAARKHGLPITIFTSLDASPLKIERMRALGAQVRQEGNDPDEAHEAARAFAASIDGAVLVEDGRDPAISEGAGTIGIELTRWPQAFDAILLPLGDGALLSGVSAWVKSVSPGTRTIGVCAAGSPAMQHSWRAKRVVSTLESSTIADGLAVQTPFAESVADIVALADEVLAVDEDALIAGMRLAFREVGLILEPSGAAGLAALLTHGAPFRGKLIATVLTGGNLTPEQVRRWLA
jgi:threonine dehydratase